MSLINCEVNLILTWSSTCVITDSNGAGTFTITDTKLYVPVVTLSTQRNTKFLTVEIKYYNIMINDENFFNKTNKE